MTDTKSVSFRLKPWAVRTEYSNGHPATTNHFYNRGDAINFADFLDKNIPGSKNTVYWDEQ